MLDDNLLVSFKVKSKMCICSVRSKCFLTGSPLVQYSKPPSWHTGPATLYYNMNNFNIFATASFHTVGENTNLTIFNTNHSTIVHVIIIVYLCCKTPVFSPYRTKTDITKEKEIGNGKWAESYIKRYLLLNMNAETYILWVFGDLYCCSSGTTVYVNSYQTECCGCIRSPIFSWVRSYKFR